MLKTNVINKNANLDLLKNEQVSIPVNDGEYKGYKPPCVVFEDEMGQVYFVANTLQEYLENEDLEPKTFLDLQQEKLLMLKDFINKNKALMEAPYSDVSIGSFFDKRQDVNNKNAGLPTPYVDKLCTVDGVLNVAMRDELLVAIEAKVNQVAQLEVFEDSTRTAIKTATTQAELDAIVIG